MREASLMKYGLLAEELACVPRCWYGWRSARRRNEFCEGSEGAGVEDRETEVERKGKDLFYSRIKIPIRTAKLRVMRTAEKKSIAIFRMIISKYAMSRSRNDDIRRIAWTLKQHWFSYQNQYYKIIN